MILDHELIAKRYFKEMFIYDFMGLIPFIINYIFENFEVIYVLDFFIFFKVILL